MRKLLICLISLSLLAACIDNSSITPKRKGYFRIDLPEKQYVKYDTNAPFTFEYPAYAKVVKDPEQDAQPYWLNVVFPSVKGKLYLSYLPLHGDSLKRYIDECNHFVISHEVKASAIETQVVSNPKEKVFGLVYDIQGNAASNMQFYVTDSNKHFVRAALYFYSIPNKDSLEPVVKFIEKDIYHMVETFRWKELPEKSK